ncbi:MAG: hypothetical protein IJP90_01250, partial [Treponema sp.]|nr:hypothetical protein [Treponema sp.]
VFPSLQPPRFAAVSSATPSAGSIAARNARYSISRQVSLRNIANSATFYSFYFTLRNYRHTL